MSGRPLSLRRAGINFGVTVEIRRLHVLIPLVHEQYGDVSTVVEFRRGARLLRRAVHGDSEKKS